MAYHLTQLLTAPFAFLMRTLAQSGISPFPDFPYEIKPVSIKMAGIEAITPDTLSIAVMLIPPRGMVGATEEVPALYLIERETPPAADASCPATVHGIPQTDIQREDEVKARLKTAP